MPYILAASDGEGREQKENILKYIWYKYTIAYKVFICHEIVESR